MLEITIEDIQKDVPGWLQLIQEGETLVITQAGTPIAEISPVAANLQQPRPYGLCAGEFRVPDDFDAPLPDEIIRDFESP